MKIGGNAKRIQRVKRPMLVVILLSWAFHRGVGQVAGQPLPFTEASATLEIGLAPAGNQPEVPVVQVPSQASEVPQRAAQPPPPPPGGQFEQFLEVLFSLRINNYTTAAQTISDSLFLLPPGSTMFVPTNEAFDVMFPSGLSFPVEPLLAYQTVMQQFSYREVILLPVGTRLETLVAYNNTVMVTSEAPYDFRVDNVRIVEGDICFSTTVPIQISCHGVDGFFNMTEWGKASLDQLTPVPAPAIGEPPIWELISPTSSASRVESPPAPAPSPYVVPAKSGQASRGENRSEVWLLVTVCAILVFFTLVF